MEQNIFTPSEHSADIYLDISTNSDIRDFAADLVLNEALLAASAAFSNAGERLDAAALFQSSPQVEQMRRDGQTYLSRFQYYRAGLLDAELKMFDGVLRHNPQTFKSFLSPNCFSVVTLTENRLLNMLSRTAMNLRSKR